MVFADGVSQYFTSQLSNEPAFVLFYSRIVMLHPFLTTTLVPIALVVGLNYFIFRWAKYRKWKRMTGGKERKKFLSCPSLPTAICYRLSSHLGESKLSRGSKKKQAC